MAEAPKKIEITDATVDRVAELARLEFSAEQKQGIKKDLVRIVSFVEKLNELDTSNVEPLIFMSDEKNVMRADEVTENFTKEQALKNAPDKDSDYFRVPKVLNK